MLNFDQSNLEECAEAVMLVNQYAADYGRAALIAHMQSTAAECLGRDSDFGYVSTLGYVLTLYRPDLGFNEKTKQPHIKASVSAYAVLNALRDAKAA